MQPTPKPKRRRRFWFIPRLSLRTFLVSTLLIGTFLGLFAGRTRQQMLVCQQLDELGVSYEQSSPPDWLRFLPQSWLKLADGHWCTTIDLVELDDGFGLDDTHRDNTHLLCNNAKLLSRLPHLKKLSIYCFTDEIAPDDLRPAIESLSGISGLSELAINIDQDFDLDAVFAMFPQLPALKVLECEGTLTNRGVAELRKFPNLETIEFDSDQVDGEGLRGLVSLPRIKEIIASNSTFSLASLQCIENHPTLEQLASATPSSDELLKLLGTCRNMRSINAQSIVTDDGLAHLKDLTRLESIFLSSTCVTDNGLAHLSNCKQLKNIYCTGCKVTDAVGHTLSQLPMLESIALDRTLITQNLLPQLRGLKHLERFNVSGLTMDVEHLLDFTTDHPALQATNSFSWRAARARLGGAGVVELSDKLDLNLPNVHAITGSISQIRDLNQVQNIRLQGSDINDDDLLTLSMICNLKRVDISGTSITPVGLSVLASEPSLGELRVGPFDDADEAMRVISSFPALVSLDFIGGDRLSQTGRNHLLQLTGLERLDMKDCLFDETLTRNLKEVSHLYRATWLDKDCIESIEVPKKKNPWWYPTVPSSLQNEPDSIFDLDETIVSTEEDLIALRQAGITNLNYSGRPITRKEVSAISKMQSLRTLNLSNTGLTNDMLKPLGSLMKLIELDLSHNPIAEFSEHSTVALLQRLSSLNLSGTQVTDATMKHIVWSLELSELDISRTSLTEKSWVWDPVPLPRHVRTIRVDGDAAPGIIKGFANATDFQLPWQIQTRRSFGISSDALAVMFGRKSASTLTEMEVTPEILQTWTLEELLKDKTYLECLSVVETERVNDVLEAANRECPYLSVLIFVAESLEASQLAQLPSSARDIYFKNCAISPKAMQALAERKWIRHVYFDNCDLYGCSLQPLGTMKYLTSVIAVRQKFSADQLEDLKQLKPMLVESVGW